MSPQIVPNEKGKAGMFQARLVDPHPEKGRNYLGEWICSNYLCACRNNRNIRYCFRCQLPFDEKSCEVEKVGWEEEKTGGTEDTDRGGAGGAGPAGRKRVSSQGNIMNEGGNDPPKTEKGARGGPGPPTPAPWGNKSPPKLDNDAEFPSLGGGAGPSSRRGTTVISNVSQEEKRAQEAEDLRRKFGLCSSTNPASSSGVQKTTGYSVAAASAGGFSTAKSSTEEDYEEPNPLRGHRAGEPAGASSASRKRSAWSEDSDSDSSYVSSDDEQVSNRKQVSQTLPSSSTTAKKSSDLPRPLSPASNVLMSSSRSSLVENESGRPPRSPPRRTCSRTVATIPASPGLVVDDDIEDLIFMNPPTTSSGSSGLLGASTRPPIPNGFRRPGEPMVLLTDHSSSSEDERTPAPRPRANVAAAAELIKAASAVAASAVAPMLLAGRHQNDEKAKQNICASAPLSELLMKAGRSPPASAAAKSPAPSPPPALSPPTSTTSSLKPPSIMITSSSHSQQEAAIPTERQGAAPPPPLPRGTPPPLPAVPATEAASHKGVAGAVAVGGAPGTPGVVLSPVSPPKQASLQQQASGLPGPPPRGGGPPTGKVDVVQQSNPSALSQEAKEPPPSDEMMMKTLYLSLTKNAKNSSNSTKESGPKSEALDHKQKVGGAGNSFWKRFENVGGSSSATVPVEVKKEPSGGEGSATPPVEEVKKEPSSVAASTPTPSTPDAVSATSPAEAVVEVEHEQAAPPRTDHGIPDLLQGDCVHALIAAFTQCGATVRHCSGAAQQGETLNPAISVGLQHLVNCRTMQRFRQKENAGGYQLTSTASRRLIFSRPDMFQVKTEVEQKAGVFSSRSVMKEVVCLTTAGSAAAERIMRAAASANRGAQPPVKAAGVKAGAQENPKILEAKQTSGKGRSRFGRTQFFPASAQCWRVRRGGEFSGMALQFLVGKMIPCPQFGICVWGCVVGESGFLNV